MALTGNNANYICNYMTCTQNSCLRMTYNNIYITTYSYAHVLM